MEIYLVRHGEAKPDYEDPSRPLSDQGRRQVEKIARAAAAKRIQVTEILHSDKLRARETAEILARVLSPRRGVREIQGLSPEDDPLQAKGELEATEEPLMLVGHLPHLGRLAALLVKNNPEDEVVDFPPAAVVCLSRLPAAWEIGWILTPAEA